jgi:adenine-specific DNA-methyltransferase
LLRARDERIFLAPEKLIMQRIGGILITAYDNRQYYTFNSVNNLLLKGGCKYSIKFLLGILNSKFFRFYYITRFTNKSSLTVNISKTFLDQLPIRAINFTNLADKARHDEMVAKVESMLKAKQELAVAKTDKDKTYYENKCVSLNRQIDHIVYDLYGLTEDEIKLVEGAGGCS